MKVYIRCLAAILMFGLMLISLPGRAEDVPVANQRRTNGDGPRRVVRFVNPAEIEEGWQLTVNVPHTRRSESAVCQLWMENGWIHVKRQSDAGLEWQVVLAKVMTDTSLEIAVVENQPAIDISYSRGRFFIKDTAHALRVLRERKDEDSPLFAPGQGHAEIEPRGRAYFELPTWREGEDAGKSHAAGSPVGTVLSGWEIEEWLFVAAGPSDERVDCLVRINPMARAKSGYGFQSVHGGLASAFHGEVWAQDDGALFVAHRMLPDDYRLLRQIARIRDNLPGSAPPAIDAAMWINAEQELSWNDLKGKVVLVDFWGTWCGPCVKKLPDVQALHAKYAAEGLVVIGVHTAQGADACEAFVKEHGIDFPIAVDTGETTKAFAITSVPAYFLIDTAGKVVYGYSANPPSTELIESLLPQ